MMPRDLAAGYQRLYPPTNAPAPALSPRVVAALAAVGERGITTAALRQRFAAGASMVGLARRYGLTRAAVEARIRESVR